jgi:hypothetical protein
MKRKLQEPGGKERFAVKWPLLESLSNSLFLHGYYWTLRMIHGLQSNLLYHHARLHQIRKERIFVLADFPLLSTADFRYSRELRSCELPRTSNA